MPTPRVSVLLPVHDAAGTLGESLASLAAQDVDDFEIVLVDDGSRDGSAALARDLWPDERLRVVSPGRVGLVAALNVGLASCRAPLVARMDADDRADSRRLRLQAELLDGRPEVGIVGSQVRCFASAGVADGYRRYETWINGLVTHEAMVREIFVESPRAHPSVMMRRELVAALGGYHDRGWPEDYDLWLRAVRAGARLAKVPEVLLEWRDEPGRTSRRDPAYAADAFLRCKAHHLARWPLPLARPVVLWGAGPIGRRLGRYLRAEGVRIAAVIDIDPRKVGGRRGGAPVVAPEALGSMASPFVLTAVGSPGARGEIRGHLAARGLREGEDFLCAA